MTVAIVVFPPDAGGNHLRNLISFTNKYNNSAIDKSSYNSQKTVHIYAGNNLKKEHFNNISDSGNHILHGHFGEIMSCQDQIRELKNKKFIIICVDNDKDRQLLSVRKMNSIYSPFEQQDYFFGEQIFLYEAFMYHYYFNVPMTDIMNISITEWFVKDISSVLERINYFLQIDIDISEALNLHKIWYENNFS